MEDPRLDEILNRLDALEKAMKKKKKRSMPKDHGMRGWDGGQPFDEKRVVDLIVRLVTERVDELLWYYLCQPDEQTEPSQTLSEEIRSPEQG